MVNKYDTLGHIIKEARLNAKLTRDEFSERVGMSVRYIASIENEGKKPSFNALCTIIRALGIDANTIFYPESNDSSQEKKQLVHMIDLCDERSFKIISAAVRAAIDSQ